MTRCSRCARSVPLPDAEICWWCLGDLCAACWERFGHCAHISAELVNIAGRLVACRYSMETR